MTLARLSQNGGNLLPPGLDAAEGAATLHIIWLLHVEVSVRSIRDEPLGMVTLRSACTSRSNPHTRP